MKFWMVVLLVLTGVSSGLGQAPGVNGSATSPAAATQPADIDEPFQATAIKVTGNVLYAMAGPDGKPGAFQPIKEGDRLAAGAIIQTRLRSKVMLSFGPDTVVLIDRVTMASIDQFHRTGDTKKVQIGLGHGLIRAASVESTLRSDMTISSPVATLSKRGTIDFGMRYEPGTGRYVVFLNEEGLVELLDWLRDVRRRIGPGQYVTQALLTWIETRTLDRFVPVNDGWGLTVAEFKWNAEFGGRGLGVVDPGIGGNAFLSSYNSARQTGGGTQVLPGSPIVPGGSTGTPSVNRPEGNFGTGFRP